MLNQVSCHRIELNCYYFIQSFNLIKKTFKIAWEQYASEIGTEKGPLRHVDENSQYPHLNGFVAFDMEHWWAERAISCMINEKPTSIQKPSSTNKKSSSSITPIQGFNSFQIGFS